MVHQEACHLLLNFWGKLLEARNKAIARFTKKMGLTHWAATHMAQKHVHDSEEESKHFIKFMGAKLAGKDPCENIKMNQSPIPYSFHSSKMLETKGTRTIHILASTTDTKQVTLAAMVDASGQMLPPMLIFKGASNRRITNCEFATYPNCRH
jgi:hypothetical protein